MGLGFEYHLILRMFYGGPKYRLILSMFNILVSRYCSILDIFYITFEAYRFGVFIVIVHKTLLSLTSLFKTFYSPGLQKANFARLRFQYTWWNSYFFSSLGESIKSKHT